MAEALALSMVAATFALILAGYPVAFTLAGSAIIFAGLGILAGVFNPALFGALPSRIFGTAMTNEVLMAVPLFIFMGLVLERSRIAEDLMIALSELLSHRPGGMGYAVFGVGALLAASTGIVGATVVTMGLIALPAMLQRGYNSGLVAGSIAAAGTLGQIIPPSIVLIILGDQLANGYAEAQRALGNFAPEPLTVGDLFAGAVIPGFLLVMLYAGYLWVVVRIRPDCAPPAKARIRPHQPPLERSLPCRRVVVSALLAPLALIACVLGSILGGIATPTEAAAIGAVGALLMAANRLDPSYGLWLPVTIGALLLIAMGVAGRDMGGSLETPSLLVAGVGVLLLARALIRGIRVLLSAPLDGDKTADHTLGAIMDGTLRMTAMVFAILIGASVFALVFRGLGGDHMVEELMSNLPGGKTGAVVVVMVMIFVLGFFLDFIEITFVVIPIVSPILFAIGVDPVWFGIMVAINLQTSFLTPPFGFALFYLRGVAPVSVSTAQIYRGVAPFVCLQLLMLLVLAAIPELATWFPAVIYGTR